MRQGRAVTLSSCLLLASIYACQDFMSPGHSLLWPGSRRLDFSAGPVVTVTPGNMNGWSFINDQTNSACTTTTLCALVTGPTGMPSGSGSAELATQASTDGIAIARAGYNGMRLDQLTELSYSTYRQSADAGNNLAIALQLNVDYDLTDADSSYQGRLVYEPYRMAPGGVPQGTWQRWDTRAGKWWGTKATVKKNGVAVINSCVQTSPCTWAQVLALFPNLGIHKVYGAVVLKAGSGWSAFRGNVDAISIGVGDATTTFDFEESTPRVTLIPPDSTPFALFQSLGTVTGPPLPAGPYRKDIVIVQFELRTPLAARQAAIDSVGGRVVGGTLYADKTDGYYFVLVSGGTTAALLKAVGTLQRQPQVGMAGWWSLFVEPYEAFLRPTDGIGWRNWNLDPSATNSTRQNWALEYVRAPMAWGCATGSYATQVAVVDQEIRVIDNFRGNIDPHLSAVMNDSVNLDHGTRVASILGSVGNDSSGMTGMIWSGRMLLRDRLSRIDSLGVRFKFENQDILLQEHIVGAGMAGATVINLSLGKLWSPSEPYDASDAGQAEFLANKKASVVKALARLADSSKFPLIVIAAGNSGLDARTAGFASAKAVYPNQVLVVGGLDINGSLWSRSNTGDLVDVYAPAVKVAQADYNNVIRQNEDGTSFAAPLASGVAVLLKDFDPSLTAPDLIRLITGGARSENGLKKLDAYGALKQAALRVGAPLCGNRIWNDGRNNIMAQRGTATELLTHRDTLDYAAFVNPYHGGHRFVVGFSYQYKYDSTTVPHWNIDNAYNATDADYGGAFLSYAYGADHDNKLWTERMDTTDGIGQQVRVRLLNAGVRTEVRNFGSQHIAGTQNPGSTCILKFPIDANDVALPSVYYQDFYGFRCVGYAASGVWQSAPTLTEISPVPLIAVPSPQADYVYVPVSIRTRVALYGKLIEICNRGDTAGYSPPRLTTDSLRRCANPYALSDSAAGAFVYRINVATGAWSKVKMNALGDTVRVNREINSLSVSEDGKEMMLSLTRRVSNGEFSFQSQFCHDETLEWISLDTTSTAQYPEGTQIKVVSVPQGTACGGWVEGGATVSPNRGGFIPTLSSSARSHLPSPIQGGSRRRGRTDGRTFTWSEAVNPLERAYRALRGVAIPAGKP